MYLFAQNRMQKYSGAVAARPRAGFARDVMVGGANLVLTRRNRAKVPPPICDRYRSRKRQVLALSRRLGCLNKKGIYISAYLIDDLIKINR